MSIDNFTEEELQKIIKAKEDLQKMIEDSGFEITLVAQVSTKNMGTYTIVVSDEDELNDELKLFDLTLISSEYMLLTEEEIKYIKKNGYLP